MGYAILDQRGGDSLTATTLDGYSLLADTTVSSATTTVNFTGLNIGWGDELLLVSDISNPSTVSDSAYYIFVNGNTTATNYWYQEEYSFSTSVASARANTPQLSYAFVNTKTYSNAIIKMSNSGYFLTQSNNNIGYSNGSAIYQGLRYATSTFTITSITSLTITASVTNAIGVGSRFQLYKSGGGASRTFVETNKQTSILTFTTNSNVTSWSVPPNVYSIDYTLVGKGADGSAGSNPPSWTAVPTLNVASGGNGGAGGLVKNGTISVVPGTTLYFHVGMASAPYTGIVSSTGYTFDSTNILSGGGAAGGTSSTGTAETTVAVNGVIYGGGGGKGAQGSYTSTRNTGSSGGSPNGATGGSGASTTLTSLPGASASNYGGGGGGGGGGGSYTSTNYKSGSAGGSGGNAIIVIKY